MLDVDRKTLSITLKYTQKRKSVAKKRKYRKLKEEDPKI